MARTQIMKKIHASNQAEALFYLRIDEAGIKWPILSLLFFFVLAAL